MFSRGRPKKVEPKLVFGILGLPGAGIKTATSYLEIRYHFTPVDLNDLIEKELIDRDIKNINPEEDGSLRDRICQVVEEDYLVQKALNKILTLGRSGGVVSHLFSITEVEFLRQRLPFYSISLHADQSKRWHRYFHRHQKEISISQFAEIDNRLLAMRDKSNVCFREVLNKTDYRIYNNGSLGEFYEKIEKIIRDLMNTNGTIKKALGG